MSRAPRPRAGLVAVVAGGALILAGCGGPSKSEFIRAADPICIEANAHLKAAGPLPAIDVRYATPDQMPVAAVYLDRVLPIFRAEAAALHGLGDPGEDAISVHDMLGFVDRFVGRLEESDRAAHRTDAAAFTIALVRAIGDGYQAQGIASQFGFATCGQLPQL